MKPQDPITPAWAFCACAFLLLALEIGAFKAKGLRFKSELDSGKVYITVDDPSSKSFRRPELGTGGFHYNRGYYPCLH